eukprot:TCONS_00016453-protein
MKTMKSLSFMHYFILFGALIDNVIFCRKEFSPNVQYNSPHPNASFNYSYINLKHLKGYKLDVTPLATYSVSSRSLCVKECVKTKGDCKSINTRQVANKLECEILGTDIYKSRNNIVPANDSIHSLISNGCLKNPCKKSEVCFPNYADNTYQCLFSTFAFESGDVYLTTPEEDYCLEPETKSCDFVDNTTLVYRTTSKHCNQKYAVFNYDLLSRKLIHKCSKKEVCGQSLLGNGAPLVLNSSCTDQQKDGRFLRTLYNSIQFHAFCLSPTSSIPLNDGPKVMALRSNTGGCAIQESKLLMHPSPAQKKVKISMFYYYATSIARANAYPNYPQSPDYIGYADNFDMGRNFRDGYFARLQAYFIAPQSGLYRFVVACDDAGDLYISNNKTDEVNKQKIAYQTNYVDYNAWDWRIGQESDPIALESGEVYYLEGLLLEFGGGEHFQVGVHLPDGTSLLPITNEYLQRFV